MAIPNRYRRQIVFLETGANGQRSPSRTCAVVVGFGARAVYANYMGT